MSMVLADDRGNPDSVTYYAPSRHRRGASEAGIRPVLERLSRGERTIEQSPPLLPEIIDDELSPPDLWALTRDPFSVIGKAVTLAACVAAVAGPGVYFFATGGELRISAQGISAHTPERRVIDQSSPSPAPEPVSVKTIPITPDEQAAERADRQPITAIAKVAEPANESVDEDAAAASEIERAFLSPLKTWLIFPVESGAAAKDGSDATGSADAVEANSQPPQTEPSQHTHRSRLPHARAAEAQAPHDTSISAQSKERQTVEPNPFQAALRAIFGGGQKTAQKQ
jgi:hypothetical protein